MATASTRALARRSRRQKGTRVSAPFPGPTKTTRPLSRSRTTGAVAMSVADGDLVDGQVPDTSEWRSGVVLLQGRL